MSTTNLIFDDRVEKTFYRFITERHSIWHRRFVLETPPPWTTSPVLQKNKFTNIYRELDPGTQFSREQIMAVDAPRADIIFNVMLYRLMCSIPTYQALGFQFLEEFDTNVLRDQYRKIYETGKPVFGNAYLISPYSSMGSDLKYENVARLFGLIAPQMSAVVKALDKSTGMAEGFKVINSLYGMGPFLAYQVLVDLTYPSLKDGGSPILPFSQNEWARLGPGALRGLGRMTDFSSTAQSLEGLRYLWSHQHEKFSEYGCKFPYLRDEQNQEVSISLSNFQNCLCEFHKYMSIRDGSGKAQRLFVPTPRGTRGW